MQQDEFNTPSLTPEQVQHRADEFDSGAASNEEYSNLVQQAEEATQQASQALEQTQQDPTFFSELGAALGGGAADAVESVGGFAELTGDTLKTGMNQLFGRPIDETQNPFDENYEAGDASWLDIPDSWVPENQTSLGKVARGLTEFGFLTLATGGIGGVAGGALGIGAKASRALKFVNPKVLKYGKIATEGAIADLVSTSSEGENLANLINDNAPWMAPWVAEALAIEPEDNPWLARIKTVTAGAGINIVGHQIAAFAKASWNAHRKIKKGVDPKKAEVEAQVEYEDEMAKAIDNDKKGRAEGKAQAVKEGKGVTADDMSNVPDPDVNPSRATVSEQATVVPEGDFKQRMREGANDIKNGGKGTEIGPMFTNTALRRMSFGDKNLAEYIEDVADNISKEAFKDLENTKSVADVKKMIVRQSAELHSIIAGGEDVAKKLEDYIVKDQKLGVTYHVDKDNDIVVGSPALKSALQLTIHSLAKQAQMIATGTSFMKGVSTHKQASMVFDAMTVALTEHKKIGYMAGLELRLMRDGVLPDVVKKKTKEAVERSQREMVQYREALEKLANSGDEQGLETLMEVFALSGHKVRTMTQVGEYLRARIFGGNIDGLEVRGRLRMELASGLYNSLLSAPITAAKAIAGTNLVTILRPMQAWLGATVGNTMQGKKWDKKEMTLAVAQLDSLTRAFAEGFEMFKYNWDLGVNRKTQSYDGRFDISSDLQEWKNLKTHMDAYGGKRDKLGYALADALVRLNTSPWLKYGQNAMGAGDAMARTVIGRMAMRDRAMRKAIDEGVDLDNALAVAKKSEENFRKEIFKEDANGFYIVHDKAAKMAGDEAALNAPLTGMFAAAENIQQIPFMRAFFPFVRTGINAIDLTFDHTPLAAFKKKYKDLTKADPDPDYLFETYGIKPDEIASKRALMEGRMVMGSAISTMAFWAAMSGNLTGDYPYDKDDQDAWRAEGKQPYSYKVGNVYISYKNLEPFNTLFSMSANLVENAHVLGEEVTYKMANKIAFMISAVLVDKSMLSGVDDLAKLLNPDSSLDLLQRVGARYVRSHFPYAGLLGSMGDVMDANMKEANNMWEMIRQRDAFFKELNPPKYDVMGKKRGQKLMKPGNALERMFNSISPIPIYYMDEDTVKTTVREARFNLPEALSTYRGVDLTSKEMSELQRHMSEGDLRTKLERLFQSREFKNSFDEYKRLWKDNKLGAGKGAPIEEQDFYIDIHMAFSKAKEDAMNKMRAENPAMAKRVEDRIQLKNLGKGGQRQRQVDVIEQVRPPVY